MRLLESEVYRGKQIRVYVVYPGDLGRADLGCAAQPALGVRVDGAVMEEQPVLNNVTRLSDALDWGRGAVDRGLSGLPRTVARSLLMPSPV